MRISIITTLLLAFSLSLFAQQAPLKVDITHNLDENSGNVFDVDVALSDFVDLYSFQLFMKWDSTKFRIDGVTFVNEEIPGFISQSIVLPSADENKPQKGKVRLVWANAAPFSLANNTVIATLRFTTIGEPCEDSVFNFADIGNQESEQLLAADVNFENIGISFEDTRIQIPGVGCVSTTETILTDEQVAIYPNPVAEVLNLEVDSTLPQGTTVQIFNNQGQKLAQYDINGQKNSYNVAELQAGIYHIEINSKEQLFYRGQLVKIQ